MVSISATAARKGWFDILKKSVRGHRIYEITSREGGAVLMSKEDYDCLIESLELSAIPGLVRSVHKAKKEIREGNTVSFEEIFGKTA